MITTNAEKHKESNKSLKSPHATFLLSLTRCCTENCTSCAVDAIYCQSVTGCQKRSETEQLAGRELTNYEWCSVIDKLLLFNPTAEFDLSGGDCLALPWVYENLIPYLLKRVVSRKKVSVTSTAKSIRSWLKATSDVGPDQRPGAIHVTFDACRQYSFDNISLASQIHSFGMDLHIECPLTSENCIPSKIREIFFSARDSRISELLLMRFFPVGRGADINPIGGLEPSPETYHYAIKQFLALAAQYPDGPAIKVQCALKKFSNSESSFVCKMGNGTWCVMPNGSLLVCPWAYGLNGDPLSNSFVAGNILEDDYLSCRARAHEIRIGLQGKYPKECRIFGFINKDKSYTDTPALTTGPEMILV